MNAQQKEFWLVDVRTNERKVVKDSLSAVRFLDSLSQNNYFFTELKNIKSEANRTEIYYDKGLNYNQAHVKLSDTVATDLKSTRGFYTKNLDSTRKDINRKYIDLGYSFSRVKTRYLGMKGGVPEVELAVNKSQQRKIDGFVLKGYDKVPKRFIKNLEKEFKSKRYDDKNLLAINRSLQNHPFVTLERPPQTLFTKDSTNIYLFLQKKKVNSFDGMLGFGNDKTDKFSFNGTVNVNFRNIFNGFESISLYWQRNPDKGQTFDLKTDIPYLFQSNVGASVNMNIFRQDSTFANVKMLPAVYYNFSNRQKIGLRGTFETSTVLDSLYTQGTDYSRKGIGLWYDYSAPTEIELFLQQTRIRAEADMLSTNYSREDIDASQMRYFISAEHNLHIRGNNYLNLKGESALLSSKNELTTNELLRFGGWNSLRGFNEDALFADFYFFGAAEYRYLVSNQAFFDVFLQYGQLNNKVANLKPKLYSFGLGFNFFLPIGLMSFQISNGNEFGNEIKFGDTKIHWGVLTRF
ncbi:MAG: hypothetical protein K0M63_05885 [Weeksellaceae bacterium]|nr:hypothetical protein [Weeksellaceae bacterium]